MEPHHQLLFETSNLRALERVLGDILDENGRNAIAGAINKNVEEIFLLGKGHLKYARAASRKRDWRQRVSRGYYAAFTFSRALRLHSSGKYSQEVGDHQRIGDLPDSLRNREQHINKLSMMRDDRNLADYNHAVSAEDLAMSPTEILAASTAFHEDARTWLLTRGLLSD